MPSLSLLLNQTHPAWPLTRQTLWSAWSWEPDVVLGLLLLAVVYLAGVVRCWRRAGYGRGIRPGQLAAFLGAFAVLVIALLSPLDALGSVLFSAHMVQHLLLLLVAPPLLVLARPLPAALWALPTRTRRALSRRWRRLNGLQTGWRRLTSAPVVWLLHTGLLWAWHMPVLYEAALRRAPVHAAEHLSFLGAACLLWWTALEPRGGHRGYGMSVLLIFLTALQGGLLGALLTFSATLWYPMYAPLTGAWGLSPLDDQRLAGVIMWVPPGLVYLATAAGLFTAWLAAVEAGVRRRERRSRLMIVPVEPHGATEGDR